MLSFFHEGDAEIVMQAVSKRGDALQFATEGMKSDRKVVMTAVSKHGLALSFAAEELKGDRKIVVAAMSQNAFALQQATKELKGDRDIVMQAVSQNGMTLHYASKELQSDDEILHHALERTRNCHDLVGLKVVLMSGRCCNEVFSRSHTCWHEGGAEALCSFSGLGSILRGEKGHSHAGLHWCQRSQRVGARQAAWNHIGAPAPQKMF